MLSYFIFSIICVQIRYGVGRMAELGLDPQERVLCFAQLLGMCDQITFPLGQSGYSVYK